MSRTDHHRPYRVRRTDTPGWAIPYRKHPPQWYRQETSNGGARVAARRACRRAEAEYRATGVVATMPPVDQHRHRALWHWR